MRWPRRARARAAVLHIHVRDPATGKPSMDLALYRDVMERVRARDKSLIINLTTGPGGRFVPSPDDDPKTYARWGPHWCRRSSA